LLGRRLEMDYNKGKDAVFKKIWKYSRVEREGSFLGLDVKIITLAETEIKTIDIKYAIVHC
jgi:hypothetical protein